MKNTVSGHSLPDLLRYPICFDYPDYLPPSAWHGHLPFAMFLVTALRPRVLVELGTHHGCSYCAFCRAVEKGGIDCQCFAVDTWKGDQHTMAYGPDVLKGLRNFHDARYGGFSKLIQSDFDAALPLFKDDTIDLLHIDGFHTYEAVKRDFDSWLPKMNKERGIILLHDTNVREGDFGVWRLWDELRSRYSTFEFFHSYGLGMLAVGENHGKDLAAFFSANAVESDTLRTVFSRLGNSITDLEHVKGRLARVFSSPSWRLTAPLRLVCALFGIKTINESS